MNVSLDFSAKDYERFEKNCNFNKANGEYDVYLLLKEGYSEIYISHKLHMSERTVSRRVFTIKLKILREIR